jgi:hypothetical protein
MKKIISLVMVSVLCLAFVACTGESNTDSDANIQNTSSSAQTEISGSNSDDTAESNSSSSIQEAESGTTDSPSVPHTTPYKQNVLYKADFDIPDVHGTGYTNIIDYYNAYPDGKSGGTLANASLVVHYRTDMDHDLSQADSLAFRTYRGIGLGSTKADVFSVYGETVTEPPFPEVMGMDECWCLGVLRSAECLPVCRLFLCVMATAHALREYVSPARSVPSACVCPTCSPIVA